MIWEFSEIRKRVSFFPSHTPCKNLGASGHKKNSCGLLSFMVTLWLKSVYIQCLYILFRVCCTSPHKTQGCQSVFDSLYCLPPFYPFCRPSYHRLRCVRKPISADLSPEWPITADRVSSRQRYDT